MRLRKRIITGLCLFGACVLVNVGCGARGTAPVEDGSRDGAGDVLGVEGDRGTEGPSGTAGGAAGQGILSGEALGTGLARESGGGNADSKEDARARGLEFDYEVNPEDFSLTLYVDGQALPAAGASDERRTEQVITGEDGVSWRYPEEKIRVAVKPEEDYLSVEIGAETEEDQAFRWPEISAGLYYIPLGEGKRVASDQEEWKLFLDGQELAVNEALSMPFWASVYGDYAVLFIMEHPYRTSLNFSAGPEVSFGVEHRYPAISPNRTNRYRIYVTENDPAAVAKVYRRYVQETGEFVTLEEKAGDNPAVRNLYGAPHIYLHGDLAVSPEDINWPAFRQAMDTPAMRHIMSFFDQSEMGTEAKAVFAELGKQDYVAEYQKYTICSYLTEVIKRGDFYEPEVFPEHNEEMRAVLDGQGEPSPYRQIGLNQNALAVNMPDVFHPVNTWLDKETTGLLTEMKEAGIGQAWIGLNSWEQAYVKPELARQAEKQGHLLGAYDSYHSIHEPGKEQWITAKFSDAGLYEDAVVTGPDGEPVKGFKNVGRKLNPTLALPAVKSRMGEIMGTGLPFGSWFVDCDAFGEIYDDYSPEHVTTQEQDLAARMERLAYIRDTYGLVVGSEGGNDFAASTVAFAHGIEMKSFAWMDQDMNENRDSEYYMGKYYNSKGGVPEHFSRRVPVKEPYRTVFLDPRYDVPLFKLVYNDSVITSYHWDWSTFKVKGATGDRMVREVLYNVPPLYHLDRAEWERYGDDIARHHKVWSDFSKRAVTREMTEFAYMSGDGAVQMTGYGQDLRAVANFGEETWRYGDIEIPGHSVLIQGEGMELVYTPEVKEENR